MFSTQRTSGQKLSGGFKLAVVFAALFCALVSGYLIGIHQTNVATNVPPKTYEVVLGQKLRLHLSVGVLGVAVILILAILLVTSVLFTIVAEPQEAGRSGQAEIGNRSRRAQAHRRQDSRIE